MTCPTCFDPTQDRDNYRVCTKCGRRMPLRPPALSDRSRLRTHTETLLAASAMVAKILETVHVGGRSGR